MISVNLIVKQVVKDIFFGLFYLIVFYQSMNKKYKTLLSNKKRNSKMMVFRYMVSLY